MDAALWETDMRTRPGTAQCRHSRSLLVIFRVARRIAPAGGARCRCAVERHAAHAQSRSGTPSVRRLAHTVLACGDLRSRDPPPRLACAASRIPAARRALVSPTRAARTAHARSGASGAVETACCFVDRLRMLPTPPRRRAAALGLADAHVAPTLHERARRSGPAALPARRLCTTRPPVLGPRYRLTDGACSAGQTRRGADLPHPSAAAGAAGAAASRTVSATAAAARSPHSHSRCRVHRCQGAPH